jgi:16S rRNA (uracil1498-N3)-methyltransferase
VRLNRVYVDAVLVDGLRLELPPAAGVHLAKVLRVRGGDELVVFCGNGFEYPASVESVRGNRVAVAIGEARALDRESPLAVTLVQCMARADRMDVIVQKATELGVARIIPVQSRRGVVRLDAAQAESKAAHWRAIVVNACEQCGRNRLPAVESPRRLLDYLGALPAGGARLLLEPGAEARPAAPIGGDVTVAIGPEGGLDEEEIEAFRLAGFQTMRLGPRVLRTETAAIAALAYLQGCYGDLAGG